MPDDEHEGSPSNEGGDTEASKGTTKETLAYAPMPDLTGSGTNGAPKKKK